MRIWYVNHYAIPEEFGIGGRAQYIARSLARQGHEATVFAASRHHLLGSAAGAIPFGVARSPDGYCFRAVDVPPYDGNQLRRLRNVLAFASGMGKALREERGKGLEPDVVIVSSPHPFAWKNLSAEKNGKTAMIFEERDIWPQSLVEIAGVSRWHPFVVWLAMRVREIHRTADAAVSLLPGNIARLQARGMDPSKLRYIPNGVDPELAGRSLIRDIPPEIADAFAKARAGGRLAVLYAGAMGPPNALETIWELAKVDAENRPYHFFLMGDGASRPALQARAREVDFITFLPPVRREVSFAVMRNADVLYISLADQPNLYKYGISMNKLFDYMQAGRPILQVRRGGNSPVDDAGCGAELDRADPQAMHGELLRFAAMSEDERRAMGARGRKYVLEHHNWEVLGRRYGELCEAVHAEKAAKRKEPS